jgi:hypothetical protein
MQDLKTGLTDMSQFPGDKTGANLRLNSLQLKLIRSGADSDGSRRHAAFAVHP